MIETAHRKEALYQTDLSDVQWLRAPDSGPEAIEVAFLAEGAVAMRNPMDPNGTVLFYDAAEWDAFVKGVRDGEFSH